MAKLKEDLTWTKQAAHVLRMTKEANVARKKINERLEVAAKKAAPPSVAENMISINIGMAREVLKKQKQFKIHDGLLKTLTKTNAALTRHKFIGRIKGARGHKYMAVHLGVGRGGSKGAKLRSGGRVGPGGGD